MHHNYNTRYASRKRHSTRLPEKELSKTSSFKTISHGKAKLARFDARYRCFLQDHQPPFLSLRREGMAPSMIPITSNGQLEVLEIRETSTAFSANTACLAKHDSPRSRCFVEHNISFASSPVSTEAIESSLQGFNSYNVTIAKSDKRKRSESVFVHHREVDVFSVVYNENGVVRYIEENVDEELRNSSSEARDDTEWSADRKGDSTDTRDIPLPWKKFSSAE
jgi:hypothetical protein